VSIETVLERYAPRLMELPNVWGVDIGGKEGRRVMRVHVEAKVPENQLRPGEVVPKALDGVETDVIEGPAPSAQVLAAQNHPEGGHV